MLNKNLRTTSLVVQWLRLCLPMQVRPLVRELRSHMPLGHKPRSNVVTNSIKILKRMVHIKKKKNKTLKNQNLSSKNLT